MKPASIDEYISTFPEDVQKKMEQIRTLVKKLAPGSEEVISYAMPAFKLNGIIIWFAAYQNHIGLYPSASGIAAFQEEIKKYKSSKGAVQFPLDKPLPITLITKIVKYRVAQNLQKLKSKKK